MNRKIAGFVMGLIVLNVWLWMVFVPAHAQAQEKPQASAAATQPLEPSFTREQSLQLENYLLRDQTIQTQLALLQQAAQKNAQDREAYIQALEREHAGWMLDRQTLKWVKAPVAAPPKK